MADGDLWPYAVVLAGAGNALGILVAAGLPAERPAPAPARPA